MISTPRIAFVVLIATMFCLATANAVTVAVLELITVNDEMDLSTDETKFLTDELRRQATVSLPKEYSVLTREKIIDLASKATGSLNTVIEIGVAVKSDYVTQGFIGKLGTMFTLTVELYETSSGKLLGYFTKESTDLKGLLDAIRENSPKLLEKIVAPAAPAPALSPPAAPALPPPTVAKAAPPPPAAQAAPPPAATQQPAAAPANIPAEPQQPATTAVATPATIPTNIPAAETPKSEGGGLGWRGITRIVFFSATAVLGAAAIYRHIDSRDRLKELDILKNNIYPDDVKVAVGDRTYEQWKKRYSDKADEVREKEKQRNIFGISAGVCVLAGGVTFFF